MAGLNRSLTDRRGFMRQLLATPPRVHATHLKPGDAHHSSRCVRDAAEHTQLLPIWLESLAQSDGNSVRNPNATACVRKVAGSQSLPMPYRITSCLRRLILQASFWRVEANFLLAALVLAIDTVPKPHGLGMFIGADRFERLSNAFEQRSTMSEFCPKGIRRAFRYYKLGGAVRPTCSESQYLRNLMCIQFKF
jgi:hypothetical protein